MSLPWRLVVTFGLAFVGGFDTAFGFAFFSGFAFLFAGLEVFRPVSFDDRPGRPGAPPNRCVIFCFF